MSLVKFSLLARWKATRLPDAEALGTRSLRLSEVNPRIAAGFEDGSSSATIALSTIRWYSTNEPSRETSMSASRDPLPVSGRWWRLDTSMRQMSGWPFSSETYTTASDPPPAHLGNMGRMFVSVSATALFPSMSAYDRRMK